jgi:hypothetical protein
VIGITNREFYRKEITSLPAGTCCEVSRDSETLADLRADLFFILVERLLLGELRCRSLDIMTQHVISQFIILRVARLDWIIFFKRLARTPYSSDVPRNLNKSCHLSKGKTFIVFFSTESKKKRIIPSCFPRVSDFGI